MNCYVLGVHINCYFTYENSGYPLVEFGTLNKSQALLKKLAIIREFSADDIPKSWWTEFSSWRDFKALLHTGTVLSIHKVVKYTPEYLKIF